MLITDNLYIDMIIISLSACWVIFWTKVMYSRHVMKRNEKHFSKMNVIPQGSLVSHGMVADENRGVGVIRDSEPSENWFKKLL